MEWLFINGQKWKSQSLVRCFLWLSCPRMSMYLFIILFEYAILWIFYAFFVNTRVRLFKFDTLSKGFITLVWLKQGLSLIVGTTKQYIFKRSKLSVTVQVSQICFIRIKTAVDLVEAWNENSYYICIIASVVSISQNPTTYLFNSR